MTSTNNNIPECISRSSNSQLMSDKVVMGKKSAKKLTIMNSMTRCVNEDTLEHGKLSVFIHTTCHVI